MVYFSIEIDFLGWIFCFTLVCMQKRCVFYYIFCFLSGGLYLIRVYMHKDSVSLLRAYTIVQSTWATIILRMSVSRHFFAESLYFSGVNI